MSGRYRGTEDGSALVVTLLIALVAAAVGAAFLALSLTDGKITVNRDDGVRAFNLAEAGIQHTIAELPDQDVDTVLAAGSLFVGESLADGTYSVTITNNIGPDFPTGLVAADPGGATSDTDGLLVVTSTGTYRAAERQIATVLRVTPSATGGPFDWGIYGDVKTQTSGGIIDAYSSQAGPYGAGNSGPSCGVRSNGEIDPGSTIVAGDATAGTIVKNPGNFSGAVTEGAPPESYPTVPCPAGGYTASGNVPSGPGIVYTEASGIVKLSNTADFTLSPGTYYFSEISASTLSTLTVGGGGPVEIYIDLKLDFKGHSRLNATGEPSDLMIWGCGTGPIAVAVKDGDDNHFGLYAPTAVFDMSSGTNVYGAVLAKEFKMSGNSSFHCDTAFNGTSGSGGSISLVRGTWRELR